MADTIISLQKRIDALKKARDSGVLRVSHGDSDVTYRSLDEILRAIAAAEREIAVLSGSQGRVTAYKFTSRKGL